MPALLLLLTSEAHAQTSPTTAHPLQSAPATPPTPEYLDYRGELALSDATAVLLFVGAGLTQSGALAFTGAGVYALGGPTVHFFNDQPERAALSLGLRVGIPTLLGLGGYALGASNCRQSSSSSDPNAETDDGYLDSCGLGEAALAGTGIVLGALVAVLVDDLALGKVALDTPRLSAAGASMPRRAAAFTRYELGMSPFMAAHGRGAGLLLVGRF